MNTEIKQFPKALWLLQVAYVSVILLANWFDIRIIEFGPIATDAGTLIFPFTFLLSDLITEVYGYKFARRAIWTGFVFNFIFVAYSQIVISFPSPAYALESNTKFDSLMGFNIRIIIASTISYLLSEPVNSYIMAKLKIKTKGKYMSFRFVFSTFIASFFDSFIFGTIAFYGIIPGIDLIKFNAAMWLIKVVVELIGLVFSIKLTKKLKKFECLDMYDHKTNFNIFKLDAAYSHDSNFYMKFK
ncbi:MAG: hypothetical protein A2X47_02835 [Lentisphaerae bacterium GWF2_38_69]|nr:MAG: hypothetical protein A2X47_02835 [Lentisphaerae bacterium GWF2_38_69]